ncbi:hypothetical protein [uncultured Winogradskyella sp.]|uniref:hypothetical protein n=1 Tax=Winogradskyella sp. 4-2091 TaxID=3381659 RepID=UPI002627F3A5|nr:hypothetical protein [uncultured Winogradskyella sp.]
MKRPIIILCYARSGGTILNKCLSSLTDTVVMSEVNSSGGGSGVDMLNPLYDIKSQAHTWYDIDLKSDSFSELATELNAHCINNNKQLIIRDWSIVDFEPLRENNNNPSNTFSILEDLKHLDPIVIGFVRNAIDVWISRGQPDHISFFKYYENYITALKQLNIPIFKYEDFTESPELVFNKMCDEMGIEYENVISNATSYNKVNGDIQKGQNSRGQKISKIRPMNRQIIPYKRVKNLNANALMKKVNSEMGYGINYFDNVTFLTYIGKRIGQFYFRQKRKLK